jgi:alkylated DNA repair dioxygenase AlkB
VPSSQSHPDPPAGFRYEEELILPEEEAALIERIAELPLRQYEMHGYKGQRRVMSFGRRYDAGAGSIEPSREVPNYLQRVREAAALFGGMLPDDIEHILVSEYTPGSPIGWHRDRSVYDKVVGLSLNSACRFRFRRRKGAGWERYSVIVEPRSFYLLDGPARSEWEHSIPAVDELRYSITFRSLRSGVVTASLEGR